MNRDEPGKCAEIDERVLQAGTVTAYISREVEDPQWDEFLRKTNLGQFQQSGMWARAKCSEGWRPVRVLLKMDEQIVGGFQILERSSWWGKIGYVSKGPVLLPEMRLAPYAAEILRKIARSEGLKAVITQPPDRCEQMGVALAADGCEVNVLTGVNEATWVNELEGSFREVEQRIGKWTRKKIRQAKNRNVSVREGGRSDVATFFQVMVSTCRRQGVQPNPPDEEALLAIWDAASPSGSIRLTIAEHEGRPLAGLICILFGQTASFWKKGWTSTEGQLHPNELLTYEMLEWVHAKGYQIGDFTAVDREIARRMMNAEPLTADQEQSRHMFNIRFGGRPWLLPQARVHFPNLLIRWAYRVVFHKSIARAGGRGEEAAGRRNCSRAER